MSLDKLDKLSKTIVRQGWSITDKAYIEAIVEWLDHKSWCAGVATYHYDRKTGERMDGECSCGLKTLRDLLK